MAGMLLGGTFCPGEQFGGDRRPGFRPGSGMRLSLPHLPGDTRSRRSGRLAEAAHGTGGAAVTGAKSGGASAVTAISLSSMRRILPVAVVG